MSKGIVKIKLIKLSLEESVPFNGKPYNMRLVLGNSFSNLKLKDRNIDFGSGTELFPLEDNTNLEFYFEEKENSDKCVYASMNVSPLLAMANTEHKINVHLVYRLKDGKIEPQNAGVLTILLKYNTSLKNGLLEVRIDSAELTRDTQLFGKMDPYVQILLGQSKQKTSTKHEAGKTPKWIELLTLPVKNTIDPLRLVVWEEDTFKDDFVGEVTIDLKGQGLLEEDPNNLFKQFSVEIRYEGKPAGEVKMATRYRGLSKS